MDWIRAVTGPGIEPSFDRAAHQRGVFRYELVVIDSGGTTAATAASRCSTAHRHGVAGYQ